MTIVSSDCASLDAILAALYASVSFAPGGEPDWARMAALLLPDGRLVPMRKVGDLPDILSVEQFRARFNAADEKMGLRAKGFHETEAGRRTESYGKITHCFSAYESRFTKDDPHPWDRGVNSIQLISENNRWWVLTVLWDSESNGAGPVPNLS